MIKTYFLYTLFLIGIIGSVQAQQFTGTDESDPAAKKILDQLRDRYEAYKTIDANFTLEIELPEEPKEIQKGRIARQGDKYFMEMASMTAISNGNAIWTILKDNQEIQINDMPDEEETDGSILSPQTMFNFYESGEFVYLLTNEMMENGRAVQQIEFKPLDKFSDYSKLRLTVDRKNKDIVRIRAFSKDGSRFTLLLDRVSPNVQLASSLFTFDKAKYPNFHIEDLRE